MSLKPLKQNDLPLILTWRNSLEVRKYMYSSHTISMSEHISWFQRLQKNTNSQWFVYYNNNNKASGVVSFTDHNLISKNASWGFYVAPGAAKGTGTQLGHEALMYAFKVLCLHKVNAEVLIYNTKSIEFHKKLGFRKEGCSREHHFDGSNYVHVQRFGLLKHEWLENFSELQGTAHDLKLPK